MRLIRSVCFCVILCLGATLALGDGPASQPTEQAYHLTNSLDAGFALAADMDSTQPTTQAFGDQARTIPSSLFLLLRTEDITPGVEHVLDGPRPMGWKPRWEPPLDTTQPVHIHLNGGFLLPTDDPATAPASLFGNQRYHLTTQIDMGFAIAEDIPDTKPTTQASDPNLDWILSKATTAQSNDVPTSLPSDEKSVFAPLPGARDESRPGSITLSDGKVIKGRLSTTSRQPLHVWIEAEKRFEDVPFSLITSINVTVVLEEQTKEWNFVQSGSDIKEYSGKTYPTRVTEYTITEDDGSVVAGSVAAPIYLEAGEQSHGYILHKSQKGEIGQAIKDMVYVKSVEFTK